MSFSRAFGQSLLIFLLVVLFGPFAPANAAEKDDEGDRTRSAVFPEDKVEEFRLPNGMTFLLMKHGETPIFSATIRVRVGGMDEPPGLTGLAHVIEHMAFKGTKTWGTKDWGKEKEILQQIEEVGKKLAREYAREKGRRQKKIDEWQRQLSELYTRHRDYLEPEEITRAIQRRGGLNFNATTSQDLTTYFVSLPSSELQFWATFESERIFSPVFREFYLERDVVLEERRTRIVDSPFGALYAAFMKTAFKKIGSPYRSPTIGEEKDLLILTRSRAEAFFQRHYRPENAVGTIVGRFSIPKVKRLLAKTFGQIPQGSETQNDTHTLPAPPYKYESCRVDLERPAQPRLMMGYHKPAMPARDDYVFDLIATLLTEDRSSRLYRSLVMERGLAVSVNTYASSPGSRLPNLFLVMATPRPGVPLDRLAEEIETELMQLKEKPVSPEELREAQKKLIDQQIWGLEKNNTIASELSYFQAITGNWRYLVRYPEVIASVTPQEILQVAKKYFTATNRCLGFLHGGPS